MNETFKELLEWADGAYDWMVEQLKAQYAPYEVQMMYEGGYDRQDTLTFFLAAIFSNTDVDQIEYYVNKGNGITKYYTYDNISDLGAEYITGHVSQKCKWDDVAEIYQPEKCFGIVKINGQYYRADWTYRSHGESDTLFETLPHTVTKVSPVEKTYNVYEQI